MLPHYLSIGLKYREFMHSSPKILKAYERAHDIKLETLDTLVWQFCGNYVLSAVAVAVEHCLAGRKARSEYIKEPSLKDYVETKGLTEEEKIQRKLNLFVESLKKMQANFENGKKQGQ